MTSYEAMKRRVDELIAMEEAEIKKLELDAKRFRWLCENISTIGQVEESYDRWCIDLQDPGIELETDKLFSAAIDKAMKS
jgi:hypothetical protein